MSSPTPLLGTCLCGAVTVTITGDIVLPGICHCRLCQKQTASAFSTVLVVPLANVNIEGQLGEYHGESLDGRPVLRRFCMSCGTPVQTYSDALATGGFTIIKAGLLRDGGPAPKFAMFCDRQVGWVTSFGELSRFPLNVPLDGSWP
jgi:hypothetical protein